MCHICLYISDLGHFICYLIVDATEMLKVAENGSKMALYQIYSSMQLTIGIQKIINMGIWEWKLQKP